MTRARRLLAATALVALAAAGCGAAETAESDDAAAPPAAGACLAGAEDCQDTGGDMGAPPPDGLPVADPDAPVTDGGAGGGEDPGQATQVEPTEGLENVHPVGWEEVQVAPDDQTQVTVFWWSGVAPCNALSEVQVDYADDTVTLTVLEGNVPSEEEQACIELAQYKSTTITLDEEVGPRSILDGADA